MRPDASIPKARAAALKALEIDPALAEVHVSLPYARMIGEWDRAGAEREFRGALELNPDHAPAHHLYGWCLVSRGRLPEALEEMDRAIALEPFRLISLANRGTVLYFSRRFDEAADQLGSTLDLDPSFAVAHQWLGRTLEAMGRYPEAIGAHRRALDLLGDDPESIASLGHALAMAGERQEALRLAERLEALAPTRYVSPYWKALQFLGFGEEERAIDALEQAYEERFDWLLFMHVDPVRCHPRRRAVHRAGGADSAHRSRRGGWEHWWRRAGLNDAAGLPRAIPRFPPDRGPESPLFLKGSDRRDELRVPSDAGRKLAGSVPTCGGG